MTAQKTRAADAADTTRLPQQLLGGLSPATFMRRYWQKKPLLIRQAIPGFSPLLDRAALFDLSGREEVESRLIVHSEKGWQLKHGPFGRRQLPALSRPRWTLLVQGVDLHVNAVHELMQRFRFVPDARLDDLMISWASDGGGVGPHFDSYDVFLLQAQGQRRWRIGRQKDLSLQPDVPLKILSNFEPEEEHVLNPGDMLYLPPKWAHDGVAVGGDCMTYSVGFRVPQRGGWRPNWCSAWPMPSRTARSIATRVSRPRPHRPRCPRHWRISRLRDCASWSRTGPRWRVRSAR